MTAKNAVAKTWRNGAGTGPITPSFDGERYSHYRDGELPAGFQSLPRLVSVDLEDMKLTGGINGKGDWLRIICRGAGIWSLLGQSAGAKIKLRDPAGDNAWHEVDVYTEIIKARNFAWTQLIMIVVQAGSLNGYTPANGHALDVLMTVNGVDSNILTAAVVVQPGDFWYVSLAGDDSTGVKNDPNHPFRYLQFYNGTTYTGIWDPTTGMKAGDTIVVRGGNWSDQTSGDGRWARFPFGPPYTFSGSTPTGVVGHGSIKIVAYPGEEVHHTGATGGGIHGCTGARALLGYGVHVTISDMHLESTVTTAGDGAPIGLQSGADYWRVYNCELGPWPATIDAKSGGITGQGKFMSICANYVHGIDCDFHLENHGMYFGGTSGGGDDAATTDSEVFCNVVKDIPGGSGIQFFWNGMTLNSIIARNKVHHNIIINPRKYGINYADACISGDIYNNIIANAGLSAFRINPPDPTLVGGALLAINFEANTIYNWNSTGDLASGANCIEQAGFSTYGAVNIKHNLLCAGPRGGVYSVTWYAQDGAGDSHINWGQNVYFDPDNILNTVPSQDVSTGIYGNPHFTNPGALDFTLGAGSAALDVVTTARSISVNDDFYGMDRPQGVRPDAGACEGVGT